MHPETAEAYDIPPETLYFEIEYEFLLSLSSEREAVFHTPSRYQRIDRELNFTMPEQTRTGEVATIISSIHPWIQDVIVDSIYRDTAKLGENIKSVNFSFSLQSDESTISDDEALRIQDTIISRMQEE